MLVGVEHDDRVGQHVGGIHALEDTLCGGEEGGYDEHKARHKWGLPSPSPAQWACPASQWTCSPPLSSPPHLVVVEVMVPEGVDDAVDLLGLARQPEGLEEEADGGVELDVAEVKRLSVRVKSLGEGKCGIWVEVWG